MNNKISRRSILRAGSVLPFVAPLLGLGELSGVSGNVVVGKNVNNTAKEFDDIIAYQGNRMARNACIAVADNPGRVYSPLILTSKSGLGKSAMLKAMSARITNRNPQTKIAHLTSETFMNRLIHSLRYNEMAEFRTSLRSVDVLMIEDIQFVSDREASQKEFVNLFDSLYEAKAQIVMTCDVLPSDIPGLSERLRNRMQWGLVVDIAAPDYSARVEIVKAFARRQRHNISNDMVASIAASQQTNVRALEGAVLRDSVRHLLGG